MSYSMSWTVQRQPFRPQSSARRPVPCRLEAGPTNRKLLRNAVHELLYTAARPTCISSITNWLACTQLGLSEIRSSRTVAARGRPSTFRHSLIIRRADWCRLLWRWRNCYGLDQAYVYIQNHRPSVEQDVLGEYTMSEWNVYPLSGFSLRYVYIYMIDQRSVQSTSRPNQPTTETVRWSVCLFVCRCTASITSCRLRWKLHGRSRGLLIIEYRWIESLSDDPRRHHGSSSSSIRLAIWK